MSDVTTPDDAASPDDDPYRDICRAMQPGLLITVNDSDPTATGVDEMRVEHVGEDGTVHLEAHGGGHYILKHNDREYGMAIKEISEPDILQTHEPVTTIEVIGIDG